jgi:hypothetical protein
LSNLPFEALDTALVFFDGMESATQTTHPASESGTLLFQPNTQAGELTLASFIGCWCWR